MSNPIFDYIIVGAGSAGCVLANRLSADPSIKVLLLEAGGRDLDPLIHIPMGIGKMHDWDLHDWGYHIEADPRLNNRSVDASRGKVLGGSSSTNVMAFTRGNPGDFDRWSRKGATGWSYREILPYFKRLETWEGGESEFRGGTGPIGVQFAKTQDDLYAAWIESARALGYPITSDYNGAQQDGFGRSQYSIRDGRRSSSSNAYLRPARRRRNLRIETNALATRILFSGTRAAGLEYVHQGMKIEAIAEREVILSSGAFNSPQLLMLSGIGPADHLREMGIRAMLDLPVGKNYQDHLGSYMMYERKGDGPYVRAMRADRMIWSMAQAYLFGTGVATALPGGMHAFIKTKPDLEVPDIEFLFRGLGKDAGLWFPGLKRPFVDGYGIRPNLLHPKSTGKILLRSADPTAPVRIVGNFFSDPDDLPTLREGFKRAREVAHQKPMDDFRAREQSPGPDVKTDDQIDAWLRKTVVTGHHPAATCPMGSGPKAVLDHEMKVRGTQNLRVVDASAMPDITSCHLNAPVLMMAEKAAAMILGEAPPTD